MLNHHRLLVDLHARTIIPPQVWRNPAFLYLGLEIYLPEPAKDWQAARELARELIGIAARCVGAGDDRAAGRADGRCVRKAAVAHGKG